MAPPFLKAVVVAATDFARWCRRLSRLTVGLTFSLLGLFAGVVQAAVLPEDRADLLLHSYEGGGVSVNGPALLVQKRVNDAVSLSGHYYMDMVSGASIDVITTASPYTETRNEYGAGITYLRGNSLMSAKVISSVESDYKSDSFSLGVSHELFGGLTTLNLGYGQSHDNVMRADDASFLKVIDRYNFRLGVTQILSRKSLIGIAFEDIADNGYLSNPYRTALVGGASVNENYPRTRDSQAIAVRYLYGFSRDNQPVDHSLRLEYRYFQDTWGIQAHTFGIAWQRQFSPKWLGEFHYRYYQQEAASFYSDNFPALMTYMARDKELSTFKDHTLGTKFSWKFTDKKFLVFSRASLNLAYDYILFDYQNFSDVRTGAPYSFSANVLQLFISGWY